ncbi:hypothetical protein L1887_47886 [Cichorium endivia]|nr:hypothetical protein L1887_47886 [Cichorium endivia]
MRSVFGSGLFCSRVGLASHGRADGGSTTDGAGRVMAPVGRPDANGLNPTCRLRRQCLSLRLATAPCRKLRLTRLVAEGADEAVLVAAWRDLECDGRPCGGSEGGSAGGSAGGGSALDQRGCRGCRERSQAAIRRSSDPLPCTATTAAALPPMEASQGRKVQDCAHGSFAWKPHLLNRPKAERAKGGGGLGSG